LLIYRRLSDIEIQQQFSTKRLSDILLSTIQNAENTIIEDRDYLKAFGLNVQTSMTAGELWKYLMEIMQDDYLDEKWRAPLNAILWEGTLATRILRALENDVSKPKIIDVYRKLMDCLSKGRLFGP
jgi:carboxylate-amine ligase